MVLIKSIKKEHLKGIYADMLDYFDFEKIKLIHKHYRGLQICLPTRLLSASYVKKQVKKEYNGKNLKELARKYDYSERWIRKMITNEDD